MRLYSGGSNEIDQGQRTGVFQAGIPKPGQSFCSSSLNKHDNRPLTPETGPEPAFANPGYEIDLGGDGAGG